MTRGPACAGLLVVPVGADQRVRRSSRNSGLVDGTINVVSTQDVLIGGGITLVGTVVTQLVAIGVSYGQRREVRKINIAEFNRAALSQLLDAAKVYRDVLVDSHQELEDNPPVSQATERRFRRAQMNYQALLYGVEPSVTTRFEKWEQVALDWAQGDGGLAEEDTAWVQAMRSGSTELRSSLTENS